MIDRRTFHRALGLSSLALMAAPSSVLAQSQPRKKIAFLGTVVFRHSHAQHFLDRLCEGYTWGGGWQEPRLEVAGTYIAQFPDGTDLGRERIKRYQLKQYDSVTQALTLGGDKLAVDGVFIIGEHGDYPKNEKGQTRYPRYEWFKEIVKVFEKSGRSVPVFNDKHLSTDWNECVEMVRDAQRLQFPFHSGSSLPVTTRMPAVDMPGGADLRESVCVAYGGVDSYDFHALETAQCMSERRKGGEVGIKRVLACATRRFGIIWPNPNMSGRVSWLWPHSVAVITCRLKVVIPRPKSPLNGLGKLCQPSSDTSSNTWMDFVPLYS